MGYSQKSLKRKSRNPITIQGNNLQEILQAHLPEVLHQHQWASKTYRDSKNLEVEIQILNYI